jgi:hypothetical protein
MRLYEVEGRPTLYLDMDGVLADFFGEWAKGHGVEHYKQIPQDKVKGSLSEIGTRAVEFFANLPKLGGADALLRAAHAFGGYTILSSPLEHHEEASIAGKQEWIAKHLQNYPPKNVIFETKKFKYAQAGGAENILVDDYGVNVNAWIDHGGQAFKHDYRNTNATVKWLKEQADAIKGKSQENMPRPESMLR